MSKTAEAKTAKTATRQGWRFSAETLSILKNFSGIRNSILVEAGNTLSTLSPGKNILGEAKVQETFDREFAIFDLNQFLGVIGLFDDPIFLWDEKWVVIRGKDGTEIKYIYADRSVIQIQNKKIKTVPTAVVTFDLTQDQFGQINDAARMLQLPHIRVQSGDEGSIKITATDMENDSTNSFVLNLDSSAVDPNSTSESFDFVFDRENLKILPGDYTVSISDKFVSKFVHKQKELSYWITLESISDNGNKE